jgi:hypothetical protein
MLFFGYFKYPLLDIDSFGCEVNVGTHIHEEPKPDIQFHCTQPEDHRISFVLYTDQALQQVFSTPQCFCQDEFF